jgi:hypothetical protein
MQLGPFDPALSRTRPYARACYSSTNPNLCCAARASAADQDGYTLSLILVLGLPQLRGCVPGRAHDRIWTYPPTRGRGDPLLGLHITADVIYPMLRPTVVSCMYIIVNSKRFSNAITVR